MQNTENQYSITLISVLLRINKLTINSDQFQYKVFCMWFHIHMLSFTLQSLHVCMVWFIHMLCVRPLISFYMTNEWNLTHLFNVAYCQQKLSIDLFKWAIWVYDRIACVIDVGNKMKTWKEISCFFGVVSVACDQYWAEMSYDWNDSIAYLIEIEQINE